MTNGILDTTHTRMVDVSDLQLRSAAPELLPHEIGHYKRDLAESIVTGQAVGIIRDRATGHRRNSPEFRSAENLVTMRDFTRALSVSPHSAGGALVGVDVADEVELAMRAASVTVGLGARVINLIQDTTLGCETSGMTLSWMHPLATITASDPVFTALALTRHRLAGATSISKQLQVQSQELVSRFLIQSCLAAVGAAIDRALLIGGAALGEPVGVYGNGSVLTKTFSGAVSATIVADMLGQISSNNADDRAIGWVLHPDGRERWSVVQRWTNASVPIWTDDQRVLGFPARASTGIGSTQAICGDWSKALIAFFGPDIPMALTSDIYSESLQNQIRVVCEVGADVALIRPTAFIRAADTVLA